MVDASGTSLRRGKYLILNNAESKLNRSNNNQLCCNIFSYSPRYFSSGSEQCDLLNKRELFSFGGGAFYDGSNACDIMETDSSPYIPCNLSFDTLLVLDKKKLAQHLTTCACVERAVTFRELLQTLQDKGEACPRSNNWFLKIWGKRVSDHCFVPGQCWLLASFCQSDL